MTLFFRVLVILFSSLVVLVARSATAQNGATLVAVITPEPNAPLTRRVRAELQGLGLDVIVLKPPAEASTMRAPLEQAARNVGAVAAVRLVASREGKIEVWVVDRVTGKTVVRELDASGSGSSDAAVAVGAVELLRASLMELHTSEPAHGDVPPTANVAEIALPSLPPPWTPRLGLSVGGGAELGLRGLGPSAEARIAVWIRLTGRLGVRVLGDATLAPAHVVTNDGSVDVRSQLFGASLAYALTDPAQTWGPELSLGIAAAHVSTTGTAAVPFVGSTADGFFATPFVGVGVGWAFVRALRLRADALGAWALPSPHVRAPDGDVGRWGAPAVMLTLGFEVLWSP